MSEHDPTSEKFFAVEGRCLISSGKLFPVFNPTPDDIHIEDIAHSLARQCRWGGHTSEFYSVAQHCVIVAEHLPRSLQFVGLLHDASEAYLGDVCRPIKYSHVMPGYVELENKLQQVISIKFNIPFPVPKEVKFQDNRVLLAEARDLLPPFPAEFIPTQAEPVAMKIEPWSPKKAEARFLEDFEIYLRWVRMPW